MLPLNSMMTDGVEVAYAIGWKVENGSGEVIVRGGDGLYALRFALAFDLIVGCPSSHGR